jgi:nucleoside recognition membrane protein YjiH
MFAHYCGSIIGGMALGRFSRLEKRETIEKNILKKALNNMRQNRANERLTTILARSVANAVETVLIAGGYIVLFSVGIRILETTGILKIKDQLARGLTIGMIEMSEGVKIIAKAADAPEILAAIFIISFGGLCVHAQAIGFIEKTDISAAAYIGGKFLCALISTFVGLVAFPFFRFDAPVFLDYDKSVLKTLADSTKNLFYAMCALIVLGAVGALLRKRES